MENLIVKPVDVLGDTIIAAKDKEGIIWVGVRWMCQGMGMSDGQYKRQIKNIQKDLLLKSSGSNLNLNKGSGEREVFCLKLDYLPIWLAKISITPKIQKEHPELAQKLLDYQLKAKDILANAFLPNQDTTDKDPLELLELHYKAIKQVNGKADEALTGVKELEERFTSFEKSLPLLPNEADEVSNAVKKRVLEILGGKDSQAYKNRGICQKAFKDAYSQLKRNFGDIKRYKDIKREQKEQAVAIASRYEPPLYLKELITQANAQMTMGSTL